MAKPVINYKGYMMEDPSDRTRRICVPQIVDRNQTKTITEIIFDAIDRGLIAGLKPSAAQSIGDGIMTQLGDTLNGGTGVIFGDYFAVRPYLSGTIRDLLAPLTADNRLRVRFVPGAAYKLDEKSFSFHNVTATEDVPKIEFLQADADTPAGVWKDTEYLNLVGSHLDIGGTGDKVEFWGLDGADPVKKLTLTADDIVGEAGIVSERMVRISPALFGSGQLAGVDRLGVKVVKVVTVDEVETTIESNMAEATKYAG